MNLLDLYRANAAKRGQQGAITFARAPHEGLTLSWSELLERSERLAGELPSALVGRGSRAAVDLAEHPDTLPLLLALWRLEAIPVLLDPRWGRSLRATVLAHSRAEVLIAPGDTLSIEPVEGQAGGERPALPAGTALIAYTSGSSDSPKGIPIRHERLVAALRSSSAALVAFRGAAPRRAASSMRLSGYGVLALHYLWPAALGAEVVVLPRLELATAGSYWAELALHQIEQAVLVGPLFELLLRASDPGEHRSRALFFNTSGPISPTAHRRFTERFGALVLNCYGLTETTFACTIGDTSRPGTTTLSVGRADLLTMRLTDARGGVVEGVGEGELEVRGATVSDGYYDNEQANASLFDGPWLRTGDVARRDESGSYWIVGRSKDAVMKGGTTVYLTEVEEACVALGGVLEAVAVPVELPGGIEDLALVVRPLTGTDTSGLRRALEQELGRERVPRRILATDRPLPRIGQDKIDRRGASELLSALTDRSPAHARAGDG